MSRIHERVPQRFMVGCVSNSRGEYEFKLKEYYVLDSWGIFLEFMSGVCHRLMGECVSDL
ncbi:hypothetical protein QJS04_geneDACA012683 [Acorus gramineus]|uniref:Uncharacterized protein n=1 Tax=Acorus gramineus TaxID=55184 RepID=A0AAV9B0G1_ACOGR|nr:hypothetical protein QJS04_geneDACA012683 [Acorus gramineus]